MRKSALLTAAVGLFALAGAALADDTTTKTNNGTNKNCFGQARSADASGVSNPSNGGPGEGSILSTRKGDNARQNAEFKEACQNQPS